MNLYASLLNATDQLNNGKDFGTADQRTMLTLLAAASRNVDQWCFRRFYAEIATRTTDAPVTRSLPAAALGPAIRLLPPQLNPYYAIPDLLSASLVAYDVASNLTYSQVLVADTDYALRQSGSPLLPAQTRSAPYDRLDLLFYVDPSFAPITARPNAAQITGTWGYTQDTEAVAAGGVTVTLANSSTTTMTSSAATDLACGQTLLVGSEQVYLSGGGSTNWIVVRAVNGTIAATHSAVVPLRYTYVPEVKEATLFTAGRLFERRKALFSSSLGGPGMPSLKLYADRDPDWCNLLLPYRRSFN